MRRRRTTASIPLESPETEVVTSTMNENISDPAVTADQDTQPTQPAETGLDTLSVSVGEATPETVSASDVPRRRRTPRKEAVTEATVTEAASPENAADAAGENTEAEKPRRTRRRPAKAEDSAVAPLAETVTQEATTEAVAKPRRPRRRGVQSDLGSEPTVELTDSSLLPAVSAADTNLPNLESSAVSSPETTDSTIALGETKESEDSPRTPGQAVANVEMIPAPTALIEVVATPAVSTTTALRRTRGLRRGETAAPVIVPPVGRESGTPSQVVPAPVEVPVSAPTTQQPRRVRGIRAARPTPVATQDTAPAASTREPLPVGAVPAPVVPVEALPPVYKPLPAETLARLAETKIVPRRGIAELLINGESRTPLWFFVNTEDVDARDIAVREIRLAYDAGIRLFTVLAHLPWRSRSGERRFEPLDEVLQFVAENAPEGFILPRLIFSPPTSWERAHPNEMTRYSADSEPADVSIASTLFWQGEADDALRAAVEHIAQGENAHRVLGFYLEHGEWFYDKGRGYDISEPNVTAFRAWLRNRYKNNLVALRSAWHDGNVSFDNVNIPAYAPPAGASLFYTDREHRYVDFHEYSSDLVAQTIIRLGESVKEASGNRSAVAVSYGYTLELPRAASGHLALSTILASPAIDILTGPLSYQGRAPGGSAPLPAPVDSILLAGKLWISEDDTKTYLAADDTPDSYNPKIAQAEGTNAVHLRNFGAALARGTGFAWMDLWGRGWLDNRQIWEEIDRLRILWENLATRRRNPRTRPSADPDVAVIVDERSFFGVRGDEELMGRLITGQRDILIRSGARIGFYLLSDLTRRNFPDSRLLLFLNAFQLTDAVRAAIREKQDNGRTMVWLYAPGSRDTTPTEVADVIGMQLRLQPWGSRVGTQIVEGRSPLTDGMRGQKFGDESRINPSYYVTDTRAQVLGEYSNGNASMAVRKHPRWQSVFIGESVLPLPLLRGLYRLAGVPSYTVDDDVAWVTDSFLCLHSAPGGGTTVYLHEEAVLFDLLSGETIATNGRGARLSLPPRGTRLLFYGSPTEVTRLGGNPNSGPPGLTESEVPALPVPFRFEEAATQATPISPEDEELMAAALAGEIDVVDKDADGPDLEPDSAIVLEVETTPEAAAEAGTAGADGASATKKKRRRRRRGRGKADDAITLDEGAESDDEEGDEITPAETEGDIALLVENVESATPPGPRGRLSLEELLPLSEILDDNLAVLPDELTSLEGDDKGEPLSELGSRRRGRLRPRRERHTGDVETLQREAILLEPPLPLPLPEENLTRENEMVAPVAFSEMLPDTTAATVDAAVLIAGDGETGDSPFPETGNDAKAPERVELSELDEPVLAALPAVSEELNPSVVTPEHASETGNLVSLPAVLVPDTMSDAPVRESETQTEPAITNAQAEFAEIPNPVPTTVLAEEYPASVESADSE